MSHSVKLVAVGDTNVGKTSLLMTFANNCYEEEHIPTVFDNYSTHVLVDGKLCNINMWDTAGMHEYDRLRPLSYPLTDIFLVCFSLVSRTSFESLQTDWVPEIKHHCPKAPFIIVGNKMDLREGAQYISYGEGQALCQTLGAEYYFECTAKNQDGLVEIFDAAARCALNPKKKKKRIRCKIL